MFSPGFFMPAPARLPDAVLRGGAAGREVAGLAGVDLGARGNRHAAVGAAHVVSVKRSVDVELEGRHPLAELEVVVLAAGGGIADPQAFEGGGA